MYRAASLFELLQMAHDMRLARDERCVDLIDVVGAELGRMNAALRPFGPARFVPSTRLSFSPSALAAELEDAWNTPSTAVSPCFADFEFDENLEVLRTAITAAVRREVSVQADDALARVLGALAGACDPWWLREGPRWGVRHPSIPAVLLHARWTAVRDDPSPFEPLVRIMAHGVLPIPFPHGVVGLLASNDETTIPVDTRIVYVDRPAEELSFHEQLGLILDSVGCIPSESDEFPHPEELGFAPVPKRVDVRVVPWP